jgi:hypothetical protein
MHGFVNSPALAKLIALQMIGEERQSSRPPRRSIRARLAARRTARAAATTPAKTTRVTASSTLVEDAQ